MKKALLLIAFLFASVSMFAHVYEIRVNQAQDGSLTWYLITYHTANSCGHANAGLTINGVNYPIDAEFAGDGALLSPNVFATIGFAFSHASYATVHTPFLGTNITVAPYSDNACWAFSVGGSGSFTPPPPPVCTSCPITGWSNTVALPGNNNGTACNPSDDYTTATITVNHLTCASITGSGQFNVIYDPSGANVSYGPFSYTPGDNQTSVGINIPYGASNATMVKVLDAGFPCEITHGLTIPGGQYQGEGDNTPPSITCPANQTLASCETVVPDYTSTATVSDNCTASGSIVVTQSPAAGTAIAPGATVTVTLTAQDAYNNSASCNFTVNRPDVTPIANNDAATVCGGSSININVLGNDSHPQSLPLFVNDNTIPSVGTLVKNPDNTFTYTAPANYSGPVTFTYTIKANDGTQAFADNGHYYQFVSAPGISWTNARAAALGMTFNGLQGYLVTITSAAENAFMFNKVGTTAWIGGSDQAQEGVWRWMDGPEAGQQFSGQVKYGNCSAATPPQIPGSYHNWGAGEPNDCGGSGSGSHAEDYAHFRTDAMWNDYPNNAGVSGYAVEFGGLEGCLPVLTATATVTITVKAKPVVSIAASGPISFCPGSNVVLTASGADAYSWNTGETTASITVNATGNNTVTGTTNGCTSDAVSASILVQDITNPTLTCPSDISVNNDNNQCGASIQIVSPTATDNCSIASLTGVRSDGLGLTAAYPVGVTTITWTATDPSNNSAACTQTITVTDNQGPVFSAAIPSGSTTIAIPNLQTIVSNWSPVTYTFTDPLPAGAVITGIDLTYSGKDQGWGGTGAYNALYVSGTHIGGNQYFHTWNNYTLSFAGSVPGYVYGGSNTFQMYFNGYPGWQGFFANGQMTIHYKSGYLTDITQNNDAGICGAQIILVQPPATDNCGLQSVTSDAPSVFPVGTTTVTWTATDIHNNQSTATQTVTVIDNENPVISCPGDLTHTADAGVCGYSFSPAPATATDNCPGVTVTGVRNDAQGLNDLYPVGATVIEWIATDAHGNSVSCKQTITVTDDENPTITAPANVSVNNDAGICSAEVTIGSPVTDDNCAVASVTNDHSATTYPVGTTTVTWTVTDIHGNSSAITQTITVTDNEYTAITAPANISVNNDAGNCSAEVSIGTPVTTDNCGVASVSNDHASTTYPVGTTVVTWTVNDIHGNSSQATQTITVTDNENPTIATTDISVNNDAGNCSAVVDLGTPVTGDNCAVASVTNDHASTTYPVGTTTVTWTVTDVHGNSSVTTQTVTVTDNENPTISTTDISVNNDAGNCSAVVDLGTPITGDNCGVASVTNDHASTTYPVGTTTVTWTITDIHGNSSQTTQTVTVTDTEVPNVITQPVSITLVNGETNVTVAMVNAGSTDNCGIASMTLSSPTQFHCSDIGDHTVTLTVTDIHGNVSSANAIVTVVGAIPGCTIASVPTSNVYTGGNPNNIYLGYGPQSTVLQVTPSAISGNGGPAYTYTYSWSGSGVGMLSSTSSGAPKFTPTAAGLYEFTVTTTNNYGCSTTCTISICVRDIRVVDKKGRITDKVYVCHIPPGNNNNPQTLSISVNAVPAHLSNHSGDRLGSCDMPACGTATSTSTESVTKSVTAEKFETTTTEETLKVTVMPNPTTTYFTLKLESKYATPVNMRVMDASGRVVDARSKIGSNSTIQIGHNYSSGTYYAEMIQGNKRKVVQLIKARG